MKESAFEEVKNAAKCLQDNMGIVIKGKEDVLKNVVITLLSGGHVLLEDVPGSGKTMLAKTLAESVSGEFRRIQMTPDLLPADITGMNIWDRKTSEFSFIKGPVFANILIADEINRATPKTQAGLLEAMEEGQVSVDGVTYPLERPFMVIATQNPVDTQGVFPLPEAQIDRFFMKLQMAYPDHESMLEIFRTQTGNPENIAVKPVLSLSRIRELCQIIEKVKLSDAVIAYAVDLVEETRKMEQVLLGVSQRGGIALLRAAKTVAAVSGRSYVLPDDIKEAAVPVLAHRMILKHSERMKKNREQELILELLNRVSVPTEDMGV